jgi:hypothetical protein
MGKLEKNIFGKFQEFVRSICFGLDECNRGRRAE